MTDKTTFMIASGASVVVVRDGERKTIDTGQGENFTQDEIDAILLAVPGALRKPINEGGDEAEDEGDEGTPKKASKPAKAAKPGKAKAAAGGDDDDDI